MTLFEKLTEVRKQKRLIKAEIKTIAKQRKAIAKLQKELHKLKIKRDVVEGEALAFAERNQ
jgi:uncharacterized coiled-coil protein SlyX